MSDAHSSEQEALKGRREGARRDQVRESATPALPEPAILSAVPMLSGGKLGGRGSASVRASSIQRMQGTYGNRSVQRFLSYASSTEGATEELLSLPLMEQSTAPERASSAPPQTPAQRQASLPVQRILGLDDAVDWVKGKAEAVGEAASDAYDWTADKAKAGAEWVGDKASAGAEWVKDKAEGAWNWTKGAASDAYDWTKDKAGAAYDWTADKVGGAVDWVKEQFKEKPKTFDDLAKGGMDTADAPDKIKLPEVMTKGMGEAWDKSFPGGQSQEQGGILVQNADGSYEWKAGTAKSRAEGGSGTFSPNRGDVGKGQTLVGTGHTHPYDESEGGMTNVPFSGTDLANMIYNPEKLKMVQSGEGQFVSARTSEFDKKIKDLDDKGKKKMYDDMKKDFDAIMDDPKDKRPFEERNRDAAIAVSKKYGLLFYQGKGGELARQ